jgi:hypothetical protein
MDHTHCFTCGRELTRRLSHIHRVRESEVYGLFPEFRPFTKREAIAAVADTLRGVPRPTVEEIVDSIPHEWGVGKAAREALVEFVLQRASYVASGIMKWIWPQNRFEFMNEAEDPE